MSLLLEILQKSQVEIIAEKSGYSTERMSVAKEVAEAIKTRQTKTILKQLERNGELINFVDFYESMKGESPSRIVEFLKSDVEGKSTGELIVSIHLLEVLRGRESVSWPKKVSAKKKQYTTRDLVTEADQKDMVSWLVKMISTIPHEITRLSPSEWAEKKRIMPHGLTSLPGPFRWEATPYLREIIDCFAVGSGVQRVAIMKGAQLGFSVGVLENLIGWIIDCEPGPTLFVTADKELAESVVETRVDRMIESAGIQNKIFAQVEKAHGRKTGDTKSKKEFPGGFLLPVGPNVAGKLRSYSIQTILFDELDGFPLEVGSEGDPIKLAERRTDAFTMTRKILYISTPTLDDTSRIKPLFESGDQSRFFVPCKKCGHMQTLSWDRIRYETDEHGRLVWDSVHYECANPECKAAWTNADKSVFLQQGKWRATAKPVEPDLRTFHLSSLYSPIGFRPWESIVQEWLQVKDDPARLRVFVNTVLGETWQERGEAPRWERIMLRREDYLTGTVPTYARPLLLTLGADVQADRIEAEIVAWAEGKESWSVGYHVLEGDTSDLDGRAWRGLYDLLTKDHAGMPITMALIDAGFRSSTVYQFCEQFNSGVMPCMGESTQAWGRHFAIRKVPGYAVERVDIQTGMFKSEFYGYLQRSAPTDPDQPYPVGYCHFPAEYGEKHFKQLTAEERTKEKTKSGATRYVWKQIRERNEQLDCRVYAACALYVLASMVREEIDPDDPISWETFWQLVKGVGVAA